MKLLQQLSARQTPQALAAHCAQDHTLAHSELPVCAIIIDLVTTASGADHLVCSQVCKGQSYWPELLCGVASQGLDRAASNTFAQNYAVLKPLISLIGTSQMKGVLCFASNRRLSGIMFSDKDSSKGVFHCTSRKKPTGLDTAQSEEWFTDDSQDLLETLLCC